MAGATTYHGDQLILDSGIAGWATPKIDLVTEFSDSPDKETVSTDATKAAYTGYTQVTGVPSDPYIRQPEGEVSFAMAQAVFLGPTSGPEAVVVGWILSNGTTGVYAAGTFDAPINLNTDMDRLTVDLEFPYPGSVSVTVTR